MHKLVVSNFSFVIKLENNKYVFKKMDRSEAL